MAKFSKIFCQVAKIVGSLLILVLVALAVYLIFIQPWHQRWGTTDDELRRTLPGDDLVPEPIYYCTHAITINAPVEEVWKWLVQIGQDRGGFYSYNWIENLFGFDIHNVYQIRSEWQKLEAGDTVMLTRSSRMRVAVVEPNRAIVYVSMGNQTAWAFTLSPLDAQTTRLIIRIRIKAERVPWLFYLFFDQGHFIMERKMMFTIKKCAERTQGITTGNRSDEIIWFISIIIAGLGILILLFSRRWPWTLLIASLGTISLILVFFNGYPSSLCGYILAISIAGAFIWLFWPQKQSQTNKRCRKIIP